MATTIRKGKIGVQDVNFYSAASPTFSRYDSSGAVVTATAIGATHVPILNATGYFQASNVERGLNDIITRYVSTEHSIATYGNGAGVGDHYEVFGFRNASAATSIQAAASNMYLSEGVARVVIEEGTTTAATPIQLPRKCFVFGNGTKTVLRASSTIQTSRVLSISGSVAATNSALGANATLDTSVVSVADGTKFAGQDWIIVRGGGTAAEATMELHQVKSISGNDLTVYGKLIHTFRSAGTINHASLVYPAELTIDNLLIESTSATQGIGIAATYLVNSKIGDNVTIRRPGTAGVNLRRSSYNYLENAIDNNSTSSATRVYAVYCDDNSHVNKITGRRIGGLKDVAQPISKRNFVFGTTWNGSYSASNIDGIVQATGSMIFYGNVRFADGIYGNATFQDSVTMQENLDVTKNVTVGETLNVTGNATFSDIYATGNATVAGSAYVAGAATVGGLFYVETSGVVIGDGTGGGTGPDIKVNKNTGDAMIRLQVNNAAATNWDIRLDNSDDDNLKYQYAGNNRAVLSSGSDAKWSVVGSADTIIVNTDELITTDTPTTNTIYPHSFVKAWAYTDSTGALIDGFNVSVSRAAAGRYDYTFRRNMANASLCVVVTPDSVAMAGVTNRAVSGFRVNCSSTSLTNIDSDHSVMVVARQ